MSSQRYSEARTVREDNGRGYRGYDTPYGQQVNLPVHRLPTTFGQNINEQHVQDRIRHQDTTVQWVNDPITGKEKFRVKINIDGFNQNEVNFRVDGNQLHVYGEHVENQNQSTAKKIIEKTYELPRDIDKSSPQVTFPTPALMQVDFPSRHSNAIIDDGRASSNLISNYNTPYRTSPGFSQEKSSTEYTSTRKIGGGNGFERSSSPRTNTSYDRLHGFAGGNNNNNNVSGSNAYSSATNYQSTDHQSPSRRGLFDSTKDSFNSSNSPTYTYRVKADDSPSRTIYPSSSRNDGGNVREQSYSETHRETQHRRSSPTTGVQSTREVEHNRSGSPSIGRSLDEDRFRPSASFAPRDLTPPRSSRNVEVREYSRRIGTGADNSNNNVIEPSISSQGFNSDAFYRSAFQPQVFTDNRGEKRIEMKLDANNYQPDEIKVSVKGNDLIVQAEHNVERPPTSSSRAYFYKQITLPPNADLASLSSQYHPDGKLHITAKLSADQPSIRDN